MNIFFEEGDGHTLLSHEEKCGLKSKVITTMGELYILEMENIQRGLVWKERQKINLPSDVLNTSFSNKYHKKLFGEVWKWAGNFRTTEKNIGCAPYKIGINLHNLFENTKTWIKEKSYSEREVLARFHHEFVLIHPYPNGNGRHSRLMTDILAELLLGNSFDWYENIEKNQRRETYITVLQKADVKKYDPLFEYFEQMKLIND